MKDIHAPAADFLDGGVHVFCFEEDMMDTFTVRVQELFIGIAFALEWLNEFEFEIACLEEGLANFDGLFPAFEEVFRIRPVRPLDKLKRTQAE